jgi:hypothetical protein
MKQSIGILNCAAEAVPELSAFRDGLRGVCNGQVRRANRFDPR